MRQNRAIRLLPPPASIPDRDHPGTERHMKGGSPTTPPGSSDQKRSPTEPRKVRPESGTVRDVENAEA